MVSIVLRNAAMLRDSLQDGTGWPSVVQSLDGVGGGGGGYPLMLVSFQGGIGICSLCIYRVYVYKSSIYMYILCHVWLYKYIYIYVYIHTYMCLYIYIYICIQMIFDIYIYICTSIKGCLCVCTPPHNVFLHSCWFKGRSTGKDLILSITW